MIRSPTILVLEHLRGITWRDGEDGGFDATMSTEMTAIRQHLAAIVTIQEHDHGVIAP